MFGSLYDSLFGSKSSGSGARSLPLPAEPLRLASKFLMPQPMYQSLFGNRTPPAKMPPSPPIRRLQDPKPPDPLSFWQFQNGLPQPASQRDYFYNSRGHVMNFPPATDLGYTGGRYSASDFTDEVSDPTNSRTQRFGPLPTDRMPYTGDPSK